MSARRGLFDPGLNPLGLFDPYVAGEGRFDADLINGGVVPPVIPPVLPPVLVRALGGGGRWSRARGGGGLSGGPTSPRVAPGADPGPFLSRQEGNKTLVVCPGCGRVNMPSYLVRCGRCWQAMSPEDRNAALGLPPS